MAPENGENGAGASMAPAFRISGTDAGRPALSFSGVTFRYTPGSRPALEGLDLELAPGEILAVVGGNGSGKTTLARSCNGLLVPETGEVRVGGLLTREAEHTWEVRSRVGLLFQNPDEQIVGASVEDDIAFGLENLGVPRDEMRRRVAEMIGRVGLEGEETREPHLLSGGQRQRLALAGVLALRPTVLVLDEPTSMLDAAGRREILSYVAGLARQGLAVLLITQHMDETLLADRLLYLEGGRAAYLGSPGEFFRSGRSRATPLGAPRALELAAELSPLLAAAVPLDETGLAREIERLAPALRRAPGDGGRRSDPVAANRAETPSGHASHPASGHASNPAVSLKGVGLVYDQGLPFARTALQDIDLGVPAGSVTAVLGPTAAGKSSLLQVMAGLLEPTRGQVLLGGRNRPLAGEVGMVFQRPETQLFAATVADDVATAPRQQGLSPSQVEGRVHDALRMVGLEPEAFGPRSPHRLSLGEQRRVALAGILSLDPQVLILDEPGAGLDPAGRRDLLRELVGWARAEEVGGGAASPGVAQADEPAGEALVSGPRTLIFTSHDMDEVAETADQVVLMLDGRVAGTGGIELLADAELMARVGLAPPLVARLSARLCVPSGRSPVRARDLVELLAGESRCSNGGHGQESR